MTRILRSVSFRPGLSGGEKAREACDGVDAFEERLSEPSSIEVMSRTFDPDRAGSPDPSSNLVFVPQAPTVDPLNAYLIRLCTADVGVGALGVIQGMRLAVRIAEAGALTDAGQYVYEIPVTDPFFRFSDGNVRFGLRVLRGKPRGFYPAQPTRYGLDPDIYGSGTALVYSPPGDGTSAPYASPVRGVFPGDPVGSLGDFESLPFGWVGETLEELRYGVPGPARIALFALVVQTDPETHVVPVRSEVPDPSVLSHEDQFLLSRPRTQYRHIAGSILLSAGPRISTPARICG